MRDYPKRLLSIEDQIKCFIDAGMIVDSEDEAKEALLQIGYYRFRGYCFHFYDKVTKKYSSGVTFTNIKKLYDFDSMLANLLLFYSSQIEIALRARYIDAMLVYGDALVLMEPAVFVNKSNYWKNMATLSNEIARSNDVFIEHNFRNHDGEIPLWAGVEVTTFGNLSKLIKNLNTDTSGAFPLLAEHYKFKTANGAYVKPSKDLLTSWIQAVSVLRNICAHNGRIYNRTLNTMPRLLNADRITPMPTYNGLYQVLLAMKYLRPSERKWNDFTSELKDLLNRYSDVVELARLNFPTDWEAHFAI